MALVYFATDKKKRKKATDFVEGHLGDIKDTFLGDDGSDARKTEYKRQREFAQMGIQWKVADARAAGIHPLFALGAQTHSYSPQSVGGDSGFLNSPMGQNLTRAALSGMTKKERAYQEQVQLLTLDRLRLENAALAGQLNPTKLNTPPMADPDRPGFEDSGALDYTHVQTASGGYAVVPADSVKSKIEDMPIQEAQWFIRNFAQKHPPKFSPGKGKKWSFNPWSSEWNAVPIKTRKSRSNSGGRY